MARAIFKTKGHKAAAGALYRGVLIQPVKGVSSLDKGDIRKAVQAAIDKNADAFANG